jgi:hypothetical protein
MRHHGLAAAVSAILVGVLGLSDGAWAQADFTAVQATVNPVMRPKTPTDVFQECATMQRVGHSSIPPPCI